MVRQSPPQGATFDSSSDDSDLERTLGRTMTAGADSTTGDLDDSAIVEACAELVDDFLEERLDALFTSAREHFFTRARDAESAEDEARQMALLEEVEAMEPPVCGAFESSLRVRLASLSLGEVVLPTLESPEAKSDSQNQMLELVATRKLDNWVRFTSIIRRLRSQRNRIASITAWAQVSCPWERVTTAGMLCSSTCGTATPAESVWQPWSRRP